jgi:hypothetical protein
VKEGFLEHVFGAMELEMKRVKAESSRIRQILLICLYCSTNGAKEEFVKTRMKVVMVRLRQWT